MSQPSESTRDVAYKSHSEDPAIIHYTEGGPWFAEYQNVPYADEWLAEYRAMAIEPLPKT